ncbi:hypothetical protein PoB_006751200 [Plakobranchus ocellatus]|uniref:Uncharacterized protein n=1 Tax=Plakobranchus ocellatus TaxID=259542 RepID=A0AAV4D9X9_9GAST|nr:hypothetical protein PoB_006751200 [Plakobranchus ocellatus]
MLDLQNIINSLQLHLENQENQLKPLKNLRGVKKSDAKIKELKHKIKELSSSSTSSSNNYVTPSCGSKDEPPTLPYQVISHSKHACPIVMFYYKNRLYNKSIFTRAVLQDQAPFHLCTSILLFLKENLLVRITTLFIIFTLQVTRFDLQETHPMFVNMMRFHTLILNLL